MSAKGSLPAGPLLGPRRAWQVGHELGGKQPLVFRRKKDGVDTIAAGCFPTATRIETSVDVPPLAAGSVREAAALGPSCHELGWKVDVYEAFGSVKMRLEVAQELAIKLR
jgi:hypothetical protein